MNLIKRIEEHFHRIKFILTLVKKIGKVPYPKDVEKLNAMSKDKSLVSGKEEIDRVKAETQKTIRKIYEEYLCAIKAEMLSLPENIKRNCTEEDIEDIANILFSNLKREIFK